MLLTHLHSDHITDLNDVITAMWITTFEPTPLRIIGPPGTKEVVGHILASLGPDIGYRLAHHADLEQPPLLEITATRVVTVNGTPTAVVDVRNRGNAHGRVEGFVNGTDASGARFALVFGPDEVAQGLVAVKPLRDGGEQTSLKLADAADWARTLLTPAMAS